MILIDLFSQVFWLGDLNYRLVGMDTEKTKELMDKAMWSDLWPCDQLKQQQSEKKAFYGFYEAPLDFKPTYKYQTGKDEWDIK
jgi:phosphatidylinositol-bisphosphatase